ncbi:MAG: hypothetical protein K2O22_01515 [Anaeroplasmataceae bacterium]|nr:hypothetical protein [Anaeroplasmataceae bacterium]
MILSVLAHINKGDMMQDDFDKINHMDRTSYFLQRCVKVEEFYDYEFGTEFFVVAPVDVNDLYNQN